MLYSSFPLATSSTHGSVCMWMLLSQFIPSSSSPPPTSTCPFSMSTSLILPCKQISLYHFSRFIYVLMYDICLSLSDLLHSIWHSLGPAMSLQMAQFSSFLWLIFHWVYVCATFSLFLCWCTLDCFHVLDIVNGTAMSIGMHVSFGIMIFSRYLSRSGIAGSYSNCFKEPPYSSKEAGSIYIPTISVREFLFLHISPAFIICRFFVDGHSD